MVANSKWYTELPSSYNCPTHQDLTEHDPQLQFLQGAPPPPPASPPVKQQQPIMAKDFCGLAALVTPLKTWYFEVKVVS
jgi:hypothetical protein